jgi:hypothetical protein
MSLGTLFRINTVVSLFFGIAEIVAAESLAGLYDITLSEGGVVVSHLFGASLIGIGLVSWLLRDVGETEAGRSIVLAFFIGDAIGFAMALWGQLTASVNALGWFIVLIYLLLALGFGYFQFMKPAAS